MVSVSGSSSQLTRQQFARMLRERFLAEAAQAMMDIGGVVHERLTALMDEPATARESQERRDVWMAYKKCRPLWVETTKTVWRECLEPPAVRKQQSTESAGLQLVGTEVVENKILASRLVMAVMDKVSGQYEDLRLRLRHLEGMDELPGNDLLRPEVLVLLMVEQWAKSGMPGDSWAMVNEVVQKLLIERLKDAYANANAVLIKKGIMPTIELKDRVKSPVRGSGSPTRARTVSGSSTAQQELQGGQASHDGSGRIGTGHSARPGSSESNSAGSYAGAEGAAPQSDNGHMGGRPGWGGAQHAQQTGDVAAEQALASRNAPSAATPFWKQPSGIQNGMGPGHSAAEETRMMTAATPMARARSRAQGVMGQIRRLFASHVGADFDKTEHQQASPALAAAMAPPQTGKQGTFASGGTLYEDYSPEGIARVAGDLREKTAELKKKAETKGEKATIEIVALMFQAILAEERIPPGIRVWFARLQMPVLRMALEDPDFLGTTTHPARLLIDRLGSCVMGFDSTGVQGMAMETEVKRIVQVIEQYPETGKKVYQVVYEEFQKFLSKFLTEKESTQKVVSVAQQVEQRETLAIQYTIEMRNMLKDMPVRDEIREFLFKVWAEVLAVAAVRKGPQHKDTLTLKKSASDLVWAASAKPNRADRARVIQDLPNLLLRLRSGMTLLAMAPSDQDARIKAVSDTLADAFLSKTQAIPQEQIDAMALRLGNLEDFVSENGTGDLPLDAESIEMMLGIDASTIEVVGNGGSKPTAAMLAWAQELQLGAWFTLDHSNQITQVQFVWRSDRKHLNLFASGSGKSYLIQSGRLAAYLQAGLLLPHEEEALTVRATRDALSKIEANPERLMN